MLLRQHTASICWFLFEFTILSLFFDPLKFQDNWQKTGLTNVPYWQRKKIWNRFWSKKITKSWNIANQSLDLDTQAILTTFPCRCKLLSTIIQCFVFKTLSCVGHWNSMLKNVKINFLSLLRFIICEICPFVLHQIKQHKICQP